MLSVHSGWTVEWEPKPQMCKSCLNIGLTFRLQTVIVTWHLDPPICLSAFLSLSSLWGRWTRGSCHDTPTCLCGRINCSSQVCLTLLGWHTKVYETAIKTSATGLGGRVAKWTQSQRSGPRDGLWNELKLENHQGDIPCFVANFTIIINPSLENDIKGPTVFADTLSVPTFSWCRR